MCFNTNTNDVQTNEDQANWVKLLETKTTKKAQNTSSTNGKKKKRKTTLMKN